MKEVEKQNAALMKAVRPRKKGKNINDTDRLFEFEGHLVKVRLLEHRVKGKAGGQPKSICYRLTASICDKKGKALVDEDGEPYILAHQLTVPLTLLSEAADPQAEFRLEVAKFVKRAVVWYRGLQQVKSAETAWKQDK